MKYARSDAKDYARENLRGVWAAALTPFGADGEIDEAGFRRNFRHWVHDLELGGLFVSGKQGEFFSLSVPERKRTFDIAVEETAGRSGTILSCSDQNLDTVMDLGRYAEHINADFIVVHAPLINFVTPHDDTIYEYYRYLSENLNIGIAMWSHPDSGYLMGPELCARIAKLPNIVAIKYSVPREMYVWLTELAGKDIIISTASEEEWLDNIVELNWQVYLCSSPPYLLQTKHDRRMKEYTELAMRGEHAKARKVRDSLDPVRRAIKGTRPPGKVHAHQKYWQELLGQTGGHVRRPLLSLTDQEKEATRAAFESCGLKLGQSVPAE